MGLDMYLEREIYIGAEFEHRGIAGTIDIIEKNELAGDGLPRRIPVDLSKVSTINERAGYWRKANQIHQWFVTNVQNGEDDCGRYYVSDEQLNELKSVCEEVLDKPERASGLLPVSQGCFFGSSEYDNFYYDDIKETIKILNTIEPNATYYYQSSW